MKEEKYTKKIKSNEKSNETKKSNPAKETKKSSSKKVTEDKSVERATQPSEQVVKPDTQKQLTKAPTYNAATMLQNANKEMQAKKRRRNTAIGVAAGILLATAIIVPAVYLNGKVDIKVSIPTLQQDESFSVVVKRGYKIGDLQPKEIEGYTFEGFYKDANLTERYSDDDKITKDITIYAKYTANVYAITFPSSPYFTIEGEDIENNKAYAEYDSSYSFRVKLSAGYTESDIHVYLGETELIPVDGVYTITIKGDSTINITGVEINTYSVVYYDEDAETIIHSEEVDYNTASTYTDTPEKPADNTYTYTFSGWVYYDSGEPITDELTHVINNIKVKASYTATYIEYSIGNIPTQVTIQKGDQTLTSSDTLHYGDEIDISYTPTTGYDMASFNVSGATLVSGDTYRITGNLTVTYTETIQVYTITIESNNAEYGIVDETTLSIPYGTTYQVEGNDLVFSNGARVTPTPASSDAQYTYTFTGWSETSGTITGEETIIANFERITNSYIVTIENENADYGSIDNMSITVPYGTVYRVENNTIIFETDEEIVVTATALDNTAQYTYAFKGWSVSTGSITGAMTIRASFTRAINQYEVTIESNNTSYGTVDTAIVTVDYGSTISETFNELRIGDHTIVATPTADTPEYDYTFTNWTYSSSTVTGEMTIVANFVRTMDEYIVTIESSNVDYGSVDRANLVVNYNTPITVEDNTILIDGVTITASEKEDTAEYTYTFTGWTNATDPITGNRTIIANFERTVNQYEVTILSSNTSYGTVNVGTVTVDYGIQYSVTDNVLKIGDTEITATPASSNVQYTYTFAGWSSESGTITGKETITAEFERSTNSYTVTFYDENRSTVLASQYAEYGTAVEYTGSTPTKPADNTYTYTFSHWETAEGEEYDISSETLTGDISVYAQYTATYIEYTVDNPYTQVTILHDGSPVNDGETLHYGDTVEITYTPTTGYDMTSFKVSGATLVSGDTYRITGNLTVTYTETLQIYTITIESNNTSYGTVDESTLSFPYGTTYQVEGNDLVFSNGARVTPTPASSDAQYTYTFTGWSETSGTIIGEETIIANFERITNSYIVTIENENADYGSIDNMSITVPYGTVYRVENNTIIFETDEEIVVTATALDNTAQYTYAFKGWSVSTGSITSAMTIRASFTRAINQYEVTILSSNTSYGTVNVGTVTVDYGTQYSVTDKVLKIGDTEITATPASSNVQYTYTFAGWSSESGTITGEETITAEFERSTNSYTVTFYDENRSTVLASQYAEYGTAVEYTGSTPTKPADNTYTYTFSHWETAEGEEYDISSETITGDISVYAQYTATYIEYTVDNPYTQVTILHDGSPVNDGETLHYGDTVEITYTPTEGYYMTSFTVTGADRVDETDTYTVTGDLEITYAEEAVVYLDFTIEDGVVTGYTGSDTNVVIPSTYSISNGSIVEGTDYAVTGIGDWAFEANTSLTSITIPESVTSIGERAFSNCTGLTEINFNAMNMSDLSNNNSVFSYAGYGSTGITVNIGANVTRIPAYLFCPNYGSLYNSPNIISVNFEEDGQCTEIGGSAFAYSSSLTSITIPSSITSIGQSAFSGCFKLVEVVNLSNVAFNVGDYGTSTRNNPILEIITDESDTKLFTINGNLYKDYDGERYFVKNMDGSTDIEIDSTATQIYQYAFYNRSDIASVTIQSIVTSIGDSAFDGCRSLTDVYYGGDINDWVSISFGDYRANPLNNGENLYLNGDTTTPVTEINIDIATSIGACAFYGLDTLTKVTIGDQVTSIGDYSFDVCSSLTTVTFGENSQLTSIGSYAFSGCSNLTSITIPSSVTSIGDSAFDDCSRLTSITIPSGVTSIGDSAFSGCRNLTSITIPEGVTSIGRYAFQNCKNLTSITIPEGVTSIEAYVFSGCSNLTSVIFENTSGWYRTTRSTATSGTSVTVTDPAQNATYLTDTYDNYYWKRNA